MKLWFIMCGLIHMLPLSFGRMKIQNPMSVDDILQIGLHNYLEQSQPRVLPVENATYDFIIVGAGPAGCVLANRLSENPKWTVMLIEAGGTESIAHQMPALSAYLQGTHSNWNYKSTPQKDACRGMPKNQCFLPRGRILGGTSSINFMIYNRGNHRDFDRWAEAGNPGWSYKEVLPYFLRSERSTLQGLENSPYHNSSGLLSVEDVKFRTAMSHAFVRGANQIGHNIIDYNGESQVGVSYVQANTLGGRRNSAANAFIDPIKTKRKNLHILTFAQVTKVLIDQKTKSAYGVKYLYNKKMRRIRARKEVILSAGAFNSPQLLMLSGVGPSDNLRSIGMKQIKNLPVGVTLYDHMSHFGPTFTTNDTGPTVRTNDLTASLFKRYFLGDPSTFISSIGGVEALTFVKLPKSKEPKDVPDVELITVAGSFASDMGTGVKMGAGIRDDIYNKVYKSLEPKNHFTVLVLQFHPKSKGRVWLENRNPLRWPKIDPKYFKDEDDVEFILQGIKEAIRISQSPAMQRINTRIHNVNVPGCEQFEFGSDDYWRCSIRVLSYTLHHQVATCKMGPETDPTTVVNHQLKVHGIRKLRVVDTSIIPFPPTCHTNAMACMIGEKAADMIKDEWFDKNGTT